MIYYLLTVSQNLKLLDQKELQGKNSEEEEDHKEEISEVLLEELLEVVHSGGVVGKEVVGDDVL